MAEISVLMSVYNGENFVSQAMDSILAQTIQDFEFIIVDDGSNDRTWEIISSYSDERIKPVRLASNVGVGGALQYGLSFVKGKYVAKADSDDIHHPTRLEKQKRYLDENPHISLVKTLFRYFPHDEETKLSKRFQSMSSFRENFKNKVVSSADLHEKLYWTCCIAHTTIMVRTEALLQVGYDPDLRIGEDYKMMYELNKRGCGMGTVEEVLVDVRVMPSSVTATLDPIFWQVVYGIKEEEITHLFAGDSRVFLWGASEKGKAVCNILRGHGLQIAGFVDSDSTKHQMSLAGYPIQPPSCLTEGDKVIITSQPGLYAIGDELKRRGFMPVQDFIGYY